MFSRRYVENFGSTIELNEEDTSNTYKHSPVDTPIIKTTKIKMSEPTGGKPPAAEPTPATAPASTEPLKTTTTTTTATPPNPKPKGYSNPALQMMGINSIRLPSRNWMIFWISLATLSGGIVYDKWQQKQLRKKYIELAKPVGDQPFEVNQLPRKLRIYVVPPPNDYLNESFKLDKVIFVRLLLKRSED
ncbi:unnamed protein product [Ambrosiozyma monospora]|uniref:Unnamed protein product n=1 Tax=Ambrosiozyma monospora TaxID=43982 RepID=A0ACB5TE98_AMBMO|nr:unnamed protein product [Ambrosiozyma monospora]